jgi:hypothetical protein
MTRRLSDAIPDRIHTQETGSKRLGQRQESDKIVISESLVSRCIAGRRLRRGVPGNGEAGSLALTILCPNSLLTGNLIGNFANSGAPKNCTCYL